MKKLRIILIACCLCGFVGIIVTDYIERRIVLPSIERIELEALLSTHPIIIKRYKAVGRLSVIDDGWEWASGTCGKYGSFLFHVEYGDARNARIRVKWSHYFGSAIKIDAIYEIDPVGITKLYP